MADIIDENICIKILSGEKHLLGPIAVYKRGNSRNLQTNKDNVCRK